MSKLLRNFPSLSLNSEDLPDKVDFFDIFGRPAPVHIEIGSGRGTFLVNQALFNPEINILAIEWANKFYRHCIDRLGRRCLTNVRVMRTEAASFLAERIPDASVDCFHIYFPDPWPKRRHHKRRFISPANLVYLLRCLKPAGEIRIATDHAEYFDSIRKTLASANGSLEEFSFPTPRWARPGEVIGTNFERKYLRQKKPVFAVAVRKITKTS